MAKVLKKIAVLPSAVRRRRPIIKNPPRARAKPAAQPKWKRVKVALLIRLEAKAGRENALANYLRAGLTVVQQEPATASWFAIRRGPSSFAIFEAFADEADHQAHLGGEFAATLKENASELLAHPPVFEKVDVLAAKLADFG